MSQEAREAGVSGQPPRSRLLRRWCFRGVLLALSAPALAWAAFAAAVACWPYPSHLECQPRSATWIEDRRGVPLAALVADDQQWRLPLAEAEISPHLLRSILAVEDARFDAHHGVDWKALAAAGWQNLAHLGVRRGASTIPMQLHRLRAGTPRTLAGKLEQIVRAAQIEQRQSKRDILVEYLNRAPFGGNLVGAGAASWRYFGRPCRELSLGQAALLAGLPRSPNLDRPDRFPERARLRRRHVLNRMLAAGMIDARQHAEADAEPIDARWQALPQAAGGGPQPAAPGALPALLDLARRQPGPLIRTTLDAAIQKQAAAAAREAIVQLAPAEGTAVAVVVLENATAECLATVSLDRRGSRLDFARRPRSTGSALKPFLYAGAFEAGICSPASLLRDSPMAWPSYLPDNYDHGFRGTMTAADALAESRNIPALLVLSKLGTQRAVGLLGACGLEGLARRPQRYGLSLAIGGAEATPLEMAEAYATLARGGRHIRASLVPADERTSRPALAADACWKTLHALSDRGRTSPLSPEAARLNVAWKTGTSSGHRDAWCAAVSGRLTVVVWMGNPSGTGSRQFVGTEAAAPLALRLIAGLDPQTSNWPGEPMQWAQQPPALDPRPRSRLSLLSPLDRLEVVYDGELAPDAQRLPLRAILTTGADATAAQSGLLWWFVDGRCIGSVRSGETLWWTLTPGHHELRVTDATGRAAVAMVRVRR